TGVGHVAEVEQAGGGGGEAGAVPLGGDSRRIPAHAECVGVESVGTAAVRHHAGKFAARRDARKPRAPRRSAPTGGTLPSRLVASYYSITMLSCGWGPWFPQSAIAMS